MGKWRKVDSFFRFYSKGITPNYVDESSIIVLNQKCIRNNEIDYSLAQFTDDSIAIKDKAFIEEGDILINSTGQGTAGRCAFVKKLPSNYKVVVDSHILRLKGRSYFESQCLAYSLFSVEKLLQSFMDGSTGQGEFDKVRLFNLLSAIPDDPITQKSIANLLSILDSKIELNNRINAELEALSKTIYDYWFVQFDFPNHEGKPYKKSGGKMVWDKELKREIPVNWKVDNLLKICHVEGGGTPNKAVFEYWNGDISFYTPSDFNNTLFVTRTASSITYEGLKNCSSKLFPKGTIFITARGTVGNICIASENMAMNQSCYAFCEKEDYGYCYVYFSVKSLINVLKAKSAGSVFNSIVTNDIKYTKLPIPPATLVEKYKEICNPFFSKIHLNQQENQYLASLRDWLLPMLMNGQVRINPLVNESTLSAAAEPQGKYKKQSRTIPVDAHILAGHIVQRLCKTKGMGRTKLQKALHLVEYHCQMELNSQSMQFAAGPHDQEMMNHIDQKFNQYQHVKKEKEFINGKPHFNYTPTNKIQEIESAYGNIESQKRKEIDDLLDKVASMDLARAEIVSTLYAVWNNRLIANQEISDECLLSDFYNWSEHKHDFPKELVLKALNYMRNEGIVPVGWGKYIDKRE